MKQTHRRAGTVKLLCGQCCARIAPAASARYAPLPLTFFFAQLYRATAPVLVSTPL